MRLLMLRLRPARSCAPLLAAPREDAPAASHPAARPGTSARLRRRASLRARAARRVAASGRASASAHPLRASLRRFAPHRRAVGEPRASTALQRGAGWHAPMRGFGGEAALLPHLSRLFGETQRAPARLHSRCARDSARDASPSTSAPRLLSSAHSAGDTAQR